MCSIDDNLQGQICTFIRPWCVAELALAWELASSPEQASSVFLYLRDLFRRLREGPSPSDRCMLARASCPMAWLSRLAAFFLAWHSRMPP